jgi:hypothetical protein
VLPDYERFSINAVAWVGGALGDFTSRLATLDMAEAAANPNPNLRLP